MTINNKPKNADLANVIEDSKRRLGTQFVTIDTAPWWLLVMILMWIGFVVSTATDDRYGAAFNQLQEGIPMTLFVATTSFIIALFIGLVTGILRANPPLAPENKLPLRKQIVRFLHIITYNAVTVYVEFVRGIPALVFLLVAGYIVVPALREFLNTSVVPIVQTVAPTFERFSWRASDPITGIAGLALIYGAFLSEVFRAGIQAVPKGQIEAAKSLGMTNFQTTRLVVVPQAVRNVLPPLGNDFISIIKDTSLVTVLGVRDITQNARLWAGSVYTYQQTYAVLAMMYLTMTVIGSLGVQMMERKLRSDKR